MTVPVEGWYPDPTGQLGERWWDGAAWTGDTRPYPPPAPPVAPPSVTPSVMPPVDPTGAATGPLPMLPVVVSAAPATLIPAVTPTILVPDPPTVAWGLDTPGVYGGAPPTPRATPLARHGYSVTALVVVVVYAVLFAVEHVVLLGLLPVFLAVVAIGRRERFAWPALAVALVAVGVSVYSYVR